MEDVTEGVLKGVADFDIPSHIPNLSHITRSVIEAYSI